MTPSIGMAVIGVGMGLLAWLVPRWERKDRNQRKGT